MNLKETIDALKKNKVEVALDIGVHVGCDINSNCPVAVELRRLISESGVSIAQLLTTCAESQTHQDEPFQLDYTGVSKEVSFYVFGTPVNLDIEKVVAAAARDALHNKIYQIDRAKSSLINAGRRLYESYLYKIRRLRDESTLPQLTFPARDLIAYKCFFTSEDDDVYAFYFAREYKPEYLYRTGVRYKMSDRDIKACTRKVWLTITVTRDRSFLRPELLDESGDKFYHYHGSGGGDCWGKVKLPVKWDGTLKHVTDTAHNLMGALATINLNSLMSHQPLGFPDAKDLKERAKKIGEEGVRTEPAEAPVASPARRGWGRRTD